MEFTACSGVTYELRDVNLIRRSRWNVASQEGKVDYWEVEVITFVIEISVQFPLCVNFEMQVQIWRRPSRTDPLPWKGGGAWFFVRRFFFTFLMRPDRLFFSKCNIILYCENTVPDYFFLYPSQPEYFFSKFDIRLLFKLK